MLVSAAIQDFIEDRQYQNISPKTLEQYQIVLRMFKRYVDDQGIENIEDVTAGNIKGFLLMLKDKGNNPTSRNSKLRVLRTLFNYLESYDLFSAQTNPTKRIHYVKEEIELKPLTSEQIHQILGYLKRQYQRNKTIVNKRNYVCVIFLLGSGCRVGEMINLTWNDIDFESTLVRVTGKKREISSVPISDKLIHELAQYKAYCEQYYGKLPTYVFCNQRGQQWKVDSAKTFFKRLKDTMNFKDVRLSAHTLRITYAVMCINAGMDAFTLQRCLRHTDLAMSNRYVRMFGGALKSQVEKFSPLNHLDI